MKRKVALLVAVIAVAALATGTAMAAQSPEHATAGWNAVQAAQQVGPSGGSVNPGPGQQIWEIIWRFIHDLIKFLFGWIHF